MGGAREGEEGGDAHLVMFAGDVVCRGGGDGTSQEATGSFSLWLTVRAIGILRGLWWLDRSVHGLDRMDSSGDWSAMDPRRDQVATGWIPRERKRQVGGSGGTRLLDFRVRLIW